MIRALNDFTRLSSDEPPQIRLLETQSTCARPWEAHRKRKKRKHIMRVGKQRKSYIK
jgi:hypothetical protein